MEKSLQDPRWNKICRRCQRRIRNRIAAAIDSVWRELPITFAFGDKKLKRLATEMEDTDSEDE